PFNDSSPAVANGVLYFATDTFLYAADARTGVRLWRRPIPANGASVAVANQVVFVEVSDGTMRAFDAASGRQLWVSPTAPSAFEGAPIVVNGMVFASTDDGTLYAFGLP